jgi:hypothetical protein
MIQRRAYRSLHDRSWFIGVPREKLFGSLNATGKLRPGCLLAALRNIAGSPILQAVEKLLTKLDILYHQEVIE